MKSQSETLRADEQAIHRVLWISLDWGINVALTTAAVLVTIAMIAMFVAIAYWGP